MRVRKWNDQLLRSKESPTLPFPPPNTSESNNKCPQIRPSWTRAHAHPTKIIWPFQAQAHENACTKIDGTN